MFSKEKKEKKEGGEVVGGLILHLYILYLDIQALLTHNPPPPPPPHPPPYPSLQVC